MKGVGARQTSLRNEGLLSVCASAVGLAEESLCIFRILQISPHCLRFGRSEEVDYVQDGAKDRFRTKNGTGSHVRGEKRGKSPRRLFQARDRFVWLFLVLLGVLARRLAHCAHLQEAKKAIQEKRRRETEVGTSGGKERWGGVSKGKTDLAWGVISS